MALCRNTECFYFWSYMAKEFAKQFYNSQRWKDCRKAYINRRINIDGGLCEECHERIGYIVHHKRMLTADNINNPDITLNFDNLKFDCKECHDREEEHAFIKQKKLKCSFDEFGQPIPPY